MTDARKLWTSGSKVPVHVDAVQVAERAARLRRRAAWSNGLEYGAGAIVIPAFMAFALFPDVANLPIVTRVGCVLVALGGMFVMTYLWVRGGRGAAELPWDGTTLAAYRTLLERRRDLARSAPRWYLAPFVPGLVVFMAGLFIDQRTRQAWPNIVIVCVMSVATFGSIALLNRRGARKLDVEIAALPPDETSAP